MSDDTDKHERVDPGLHSDGCSCAECDCECSEHCPVHVPVSLDQWQSIAAWRANATPSVLTWLEKMAKQARRAKDPDADGFDALLELTRALSR